MYIQLSSRRFSSRSLQAARGHIQQKWSLGYKQKKRKHITYQINTLKKTEKEIRVTWYVIWQFDRFLSYIIFTVLPERKKWNLKSTVTHDPFAIWGFVHTPDCDSLRSTPSLWHGRCPGRWRCPCVRGPACYTAPLGRCPQSYDSSCVSDSPRCETRTLYLQTKKKKKLFPVIELRLRYTWHKACQCCGNMLTELSACWRER